MEIVFRTLNRYKVSHNLFKFQTRQFFSQEFASFSFFFFFTRLLGYTIASVDVSGNHRVYHNRVSFFVRSEVINRGKTCLRPVLTATRL